MGFIKLNKKDRRRARETVWLDPCLELHDTPDSMSDYCVSKLKGMGVRIDTKPDVGSAISKMTTSYQNVLRLSANFEGLHPMYQAAILAHELVHYRQRQDYGRHTFNAKYIFSPRWRMSVEIPAYREEVRALKILGLSRDRLKAHISRIPKSLKKYKIGVLDFQSLGRLTINTLEKEL